jgi:hypothetical protein
MEGLGVACGKRQVAALRWLPIDEHQGQIDREDYWNRKNHGFPPADETAVTWLMGLKVDPDGSAFPMTPPTGGGSSTFEHIAKAIYLVFNNGAVVSVLEVVSMLSRLQCQALYALRRLGELPMAEQEPKPGGQLKSGQRPEAYCDIGAQETPNVRHERRDAAGEACRGTSARWRG